MQTRANVESSWQTQYFQLVQTKSSLQKVDIMTKTVPRANFTTFRNYVVRDIVYEDVMFTKSTAQKANGMTEPLPRADFRTFHDQVASDHTVRDAV